MIFHDPPPTHKNAEWITAMIVFYGRQGAMEPIAKSLSASIWGKLLDLGTMLIRSEDGLIHSAAVRSAGLHL